MDNDAAVTLANHWHELADEETASRGYSPVLRVLRTLLPDVTAGGAALVDGVPTVLALDGTHVFAVSVDASDEGQPPTRVRRLPLAPERVSVTLLNNPAGSLSDGKIPAHLRGWRFRWDGGEELAVDTVVQVRTGWQNGPNSGVRQAGSDGHLQARISSWGEEPFLSYGCPEEVQRRVA